MVSKPIVHNTLTVSEENYSESYKKNKENSKTPQDSKKLQHPVNLLSSQHYYNILKSLNISFNDLGGFTSKLTILCPAISQPIRFSLSPIVISLLLLEKFKNFPLIQETVYINFFNIKRLILQFDSSKYEIIYNQTLSLLCLIRDTIRNIIGQNLSPDLVFIIFTCAELLKNINSIPLEFIISAVNNCLKISSTITEINSLPSIFSLFTSEINPFLPQYSHKEYTLVLDLDETLGHYSNGKFLLRPGVHQFINEMNQHFELVLFTAASRGYADWAMDTVDPEGIIKLRLYKQHTINESIKDLEMLGRDINKVILIDNCWKCFEKQPDNAIEISSWVGDPNDTKLFNLAKSLASLPYCKIKSLKQSLMKLKLF